MRIGNWITVVFILLVAQVHAAAPESTNSLPPGLPAFYKFKGYSQGLALLGKQFFSSMELSKNKNISCESCHKFSSSTADSIAFSVGTHGDSGSRNSPIIFNLYLNNSLMFDGEASDILRQVSLPLEDKFEMDIEIDEALVNLNRKPELKNFANCLGYFAIDYGLIKKSLASYVSSLVSGGSRFDKYLYGSETRILSASEKRGFELFRGKARCTSCHKIDTTFALFSDNGFHNLGVGYTNGKFNDSGRYNVTGLQGDQGKFKTPSLRNISKTAPYMHDGSLSTLEKVVEFYNDGGISNPFLDRKIKPLNLSDSEMKDLSNFLISLESPVYFYNELNTTALICRPPSETK